MSCQGEQVPELPLITPLTGFGVIPAGSGVAPDSGGSSISSTTAGIVPPDAPTPDHPRTRLQAGILQPKVYTDGTVCYGCYTSTGEP